MQYSKILLQKLSLVKDKVKNLPYKKVSVLVALSAGTIFISANAALKDIKQPKIEWNQKKIEVTLFQGTSKIASPSFIANKNIEGAKFELVPKLAKFASVKPAEISNITVGQNNSINLLFSISQATNLGIYEGTLHLKSDKKTIPQTLKIVLNVKEPTVDEIPEDISYPTADKIYEDPEAGVAYVKDEILIVFKKDISEDDIKSVVSDINGMFLSAIVDMNLYRIRISNIDQLESIINELNNKSEVLMADYHWIFEEF